MHWPRRRGALAGPVELVALLRSLDDVVGELLAEQVEVDRADRVAIGVDGLGDDAREQLGDLVDVARRQVR